MATTRKKSTAPKTKNPKTPLPAKETKKTVAATTKNRAVTKIVKLTPPKHTSAKNIIGDNNITMRPTTKLKLLTSLIYAGLAVAAGMLMNSTTYQVFTGHLAKNELVSIDTTVFAPALRSLFDVELRWALVAILALAALLPLYHFVRKKSENELTVDRRTHFWIWLETAVVAALLVETVALLSGIQDIWTLKIIGGLVVICGLLGWSAEKQKAEASNSTRSSFVLGVVAGFLPWMMIAGYDVATVVYGTLRSPWYVYAIQAIVLLGFVAGAANLRNSLKRKYDARTIERNYLVINLFTRVAFAAVLIQGFLK